MGIEWIWQLPSRRPRNRASNVIRSLFNYHHLHDWFRLLSSLLLPWFLSVQEKKNMVSGGKIRKSFRVKYYTDRPHEKNKVKISKVTRKNFPWSFLRDRVIRNVFFLLFLSLRETLKKAFSDFILFFFHIGEFWPVILIKSNNRDSDLRRSNKSD